MTYLSDDERDAMLESLIEELLEMTTPEKEAEHEPPHKNSRIANKASCLCYIM
jgi:hypothetical protein